MIPKFWTFFWKKKCPFSKKPLLKSLTSTDLILYLKESLKEPSDKLIGEIIQYHGFIHEGLCPCNYEPEDFLRSKMDILQIEIWEDCLIWKDCILININMDLFIEECISQESGFLRFEFGLPIQRLQLAFFESATGFKTVLCQK